jgi:hypothetical protein
LLLALSRKRAVVIASALCGCVGSACVAAHVNVGPIVTREQVRAITLHMTLAEVVSILGQPFETEKLKGSDMVTLHYRPRPLGFRFYSALWVLFKDGKVNSVGAKRYGWWLVDDDWGVYILDADKKWESPDFDSVFPSGDPLKRAQNGHK